MAMAALSIEECGEILEDFRALNLDFSDMLLQQLAGNYGLDAICDIDPLDIVDILSKQGRFVVLTSNAANLQRADSCLIDILDDAKSQGIQPGCIAGALLIVKQTGMRFNAFAKMHTRLMEVLHPGVQFFQAMYADPGLDQGVHLMLILTGINTLNEFVGPRPRRS